jgi:hypothetical protein
MKSRTSRTKETQYTVRAIPVRVDRELRKRAERERKSLNALLVQILSEAAGEDRARMRRRDLSKYSGSWIDDPEFDRAMEEFERIDEEMWR